MNASCGGALSLQWSTAVHGIELIRWLERAGRPRAGRPRAGLPRAGLPRAGLLLLAGDLVL